MKIIIDESKRYKLPIIMLQEIKWPRSGIIKANDTTIFYSRSKGPRNEIGVGLMNNEALLPKVNRFEAIYERLCYIQILIPNYDLLIINCHTSTKEKQEEIKNEFYKDFKQVYDTLPKHSVIVVISDINAKLGQKEDYRTTNDRKSLLQYVER